MEIITINSLEELNAILLKANKLHSRIVLFKHSTRCSISNMAYSRLQRTWKSSLPIYLIDVLKNRDVSNLVASQFNIQHESPQILVVSGDKCIYTASHSEINFKEIDDALNTIAT